MPTIKEIAKIKGSNIQHIELIRKQLNITQAFMGECLGKSKSVWNQWIKQRNAIPEEYMDQVINIFTTIDALQNGQKCLPAATTNKGEILIEVEQFLNKLSDPRISIFEDRNRYALKLLKHNSEEAKKLLNKIQQL